MASSPFVSAGTDQVDNPKEIHIKRAAPLVHIGVDQTRDGVQDAVVDDDGIETAVRGEHGGRNLRCGAGCPHVSCQPLYRSLRMGRFERFQVGYRAGR